jgi:hypothetical protein
MKKHFLYPRFRTINLASAIFLLACGLPALAQTPAKKAPAAKAPAAPAAKPAAAPARPASAGGTAGRPGGTTTASHTTGPTTTTAGGARTTTNTAGAGARNNTTTTSSHTTASGGAAAGGSAARGGFGGRDGARPNVAHGGPGSRPTPAGVHEVRASNGALVRTRPNGTRSDLHDERRGMDVHRGLNGERRISVERADHSRVFAERGGRGYVQHPYMYRGHEFGHRTYYHDGRAYDRYYGRYPYRGVYLDVYAPNRYYAPGFYGWAYNPWAVPVAYSWGWNANPWYGYYGAAYFTPYSVYPSASFWLTDYLISQSLAAAYEARAADQANAAAMQGAAPLTPDVKKMVADEIQRQVALENAEAAQNTKQQDVDSRSSSIERMLSDNQPHVFIAGSNLDLVDSSGAECAVSIGDVIEVATPPPYDATAANALVLSSKGGKECPKSANVQVAFTDLQDMQNHMRETIDQGLGDLQSKQGKGGLPPAPPSALAPPVASSFAAAAPPPDPNAATEISQQIKEADKAEQEVASIAPPASGPSDQAPAPAAPVQTQTVTIGESLSQVTAAFGQPSKVLDKGATKIYVYPDMKVTVKGDKVSDVN